MVDCGGGGLVQTSGEVDAGDLVSNGSKCGGKNIRPAGLDTGDLVAFSAILVA